MSKRDKVIDRLLSRPSDFEYDDRVAFVNSGTKHIIRLHRPHPGNLLKKYQIELLIEELRSQGVIQ